MSDQPPGWRQGRLGSLVRTIVPQRNKPDDLTGPIPWIRIEDFDGKVITSSRTAQGVTAGQVAGMPLRLFPTGTVICSCSCSMGATAIAGAPLVTNQTFIGLVPGPELESGYLYYLLQSMKEEMQSRATGAIQQYLSQDDFRSLRVPVPTLADQRRIADFLDAKIVRIEGLIRLREAQIAATEERRLASVDLLVREGVGHNQFVAAEFKPLVRVPSPWRQARLRDVRCDVQTGPFGSQLHAEEYVTDGWPVINPANIQGQRLVSDASMTVDDVTRARLARHILRAGDVVFGRRGELGRAGLVGPDEEGWVCGTGLLRVRFLGQEFDAAYLAHYLRIPALRHYFLSQSVGSTMDNLNTEILLRMPLLIPSLSEQGQIAVACDAVLDRGREILDALRRSIKLLGEHRTALTTAAITGQLDVSTARGAA